MKQKFVVNNFDLIRLLAALQVALIHSFHHLEIAHTEWGIHKLLTYFPGVPIFFFVSGFLISKSFENNSHKMEYAQNRIFRIFPALIVCTLVAIISVYLSGYFNKVDFSLVHFIAWILGQVSFVQFYNPEFMRGFGTGVLNGSLWTISVELQFYILVPVLYWVFSWFNNKRKNIILILFIIVFLGLNFLYFELKSTMSDSMYVKLFGVSFIPWFYMFLIGVLFQYNYEYIRGILGERFILMLLLYIVFTYLSVEYLGFNVGNGISPILYLLLAGLIFSFAYSFSDLSNKLLWRNDISYGVYIYHIPVINIFIYFGYISNTYIMVISIIATLILAAISWFVVERPSLKLKKHPLNPLKV